MLVCVAACLASRQHVAEEEFEISGFREEHVDIPRHISARAGARSLAFVSMATHILRRAREARAANKPRLFDGYRFALRPAKCVRARDVCVMERLSE